MLSRSFNKRSFFLKVAFLFSDVSDPRLTQHVSCFDEKNSAEDEKSCFHIRFDKPCGYEEKFKRLHLYVCQTFGNQFVLFIYFCIYFFFIYLFIFFFFFFFFADNFTGSKDTEPYKTRTFLFCVSICTDLPKIRTK